MKKILGFIILAGFLFIPSGWAADTLQILNLQGDVQVLISGSNVWQPASKGMTLSPGDQVKTANASSVEIQAGQGLVTLDENTQFAVNEHTVVGPDEMKTSLQLALGKLKAKVEKLKGDSEFKVVTPTSIAGVRGTWFDMWVYLFNNEFFSRLEVNEGLVNFADLDSDQNVDVGEGEYSTGGEEGVSDPQPTPEEASMDTEGDGQEDEEVDQTDNSIGDQFNAQPGFEQDTPGSQSNAQGNPAEDDSSSDSSYGSYPNPWTS